MVFTTLWNLKQELVVFLRNQDIISITDRGVTTSQDTGTFTAASSHTVLTNPTLLKNVRDITVDSTELTFGNDYTVDYSTGVITFTENQTGDYIINYDQGTNDRIFPDFPQPHIKIGQFPRIAIDIISGSTAEIELGAGTTQSNYTTSIVAYDKHQDDVEAMVGAIRQSLLENKKNFYYAQFITPTSMGPLLISPFGQNKIVQRNQDASIQFIFEDSSPSITPSSTLLNNIFAYYKLDDTSPVVDSTGTVVSGTPTGVTQGIAGKVGLAVGFAGTTSSYINLGTMDSWASTLTEGSIAVWLMTTETGDSMPIAQYNGSQNIFLRTNFPSTGKLTFYIRDTSNNTMSGNFTPSSAFNDNAWHLLIISWDCSINTIKFYFDNVLETTTNVDQGTPSNFNDATQPLYLGLRNSGGFGFAYEGDLDEFGLWTRQLTIDEISEVWNSGTGVTYPFT